MLTNFSGTIVKYYKRNVATGETYFGIDTEELGVIRNSDGLVFSYGIIPNWPIELKVIVTGEWEDNAFHIAYAKPVAETAEMSLKLIKQVIKDIKEDDPEFKISNTVPKKILGVTGIDIITFIKTETAKETLITGLPKVAPEKIEKIYEELKKICLQYDVLNFIVSHGGEVFASEKLVHMYGARALENLKKHPYIIGNKVMLDFYVCDRMGKDLGFDPLCDERINAAAYATVNAYIESSGSTFVPVEKFKKGITRILSQSSYPETIISDAILAIQLPRLSGIVVETGNEDIRIYKRALYDAEKKISKNLSRIEQAKESYEFDDSKIEEVERLLGIKYSKEQKEAFNALRSSGIKIITGGPGTGKTTVINGILYFYEKLHPAKKLLLCAPTGRAAQRMSEVTEKDASTIHRAIDLKPYTDDVLISKNEKDPIDADVIVLDEMSMVDTTILSILLPAIKSGSTLILVGDENQLQSVEAGNVLHDIIASNRYEAYRLKEVFRQKGKQTIIDNANKVLNKNSKMVRDNMFEIKNLSSAEDAVAEVLKDFDKARKDGKEKSLQILSPTKVGESGTFELNKIISEEINREEELIIGKNVFYYGKNTYHLNDKVIFLKNNYEKDYFNGDIGYIVEIHPNRLYVKLQGQKKDAIEVSGKDLRDLTLAYSITIHKSQGSENENIIIILNNAYMNMIDKNMLFTAITRAKSHVKIINLNAAFYKAIYNDRIKVRDTGLNDKLMNKKYKIIV